VVAGWRYGAFRVVGLEFRTGTSRVDPQRLAPHLEQLEYLEFVKMPNSTAAETTEWREQLAGQTVFHCASHGP
jgi:hypothetical protein